MGTMPYLSGLLALKLRQRKLKMKQRKSVLAVTLGKTGTRISDPS